MYCSVADLLVLFMYDRCFVFLSEYNEYKDKKQAVREAATICPRPLQVDRWPFTLTVVSESRVTWATSVPILVFIGLSILDL